MNKTTLTVIGIGLIVGLAVLARFAPRADGGQFDAFAQCLAAQGVTMYGADWCPHCQNEKKAFGSSFKYVPYIECPKNPEVCLAEGVKGYPTWIFLDGRKLEGEQGVERLAKESGCLLPQIEQY